MSYKYVYKLATFMFIAHTLGYTVIIKYPYLYCYIIEECKRKIDGKVGVNYFIYVDIRVWARYNMQDIISNCKPMGYIQAVY